MVEDENLKKEKIAVLRLPAGIDPEGSPVLEHVEAYVLNKPGHYELIKSPLFVRNLARGDVFHVTEERPDRVTVVSRSGMIALRVLKKSDADRLEQALTPEVEKLGGTLDVKTERGLSYSLHVNVGFAAIEELFDRIMADFQDTVWYYGNVYDPRDGVTPLNWWDRFINQV